MSVVSNSTLSLYRQCPPGLGGADCEIATCNSTFVAPSARVDKANSTELCSTCDAGFTGLNCNICSGITSCSLRQSAVGRGSSGVASSGLLSVNNTLTCDNQPKAITQTNVQCDVDQPTLSALFPGKITLTAIKVANVPDWDTTGLSSWNASANSSYSQVFLDGIEQSTGCSSTNTTSSVGSSAILGTENWSCDTLQCYCIPSSKICSNPSFSLASVIDGLSGELDFPCDYLDPSQSTTSCAFKSTTLNQFVGTAGLPLKNCTFGQCLSQYALEQDWIAASQIAAVAKGSHLSGGVVAGLTLLGVAIAALLAVFGWGYMLLRAARKGILVDDGKAVGLGWENIHYRVKGVRHSSAVPLLFKRRRGSRSREREDSYELGTMQTLEGEANDRSHGLILNNVSCQAEPGLLTIIIGASGAGKSSLMDILGGRLKTGQIGGQLYYLSEEEIQLRSRERRRRIAVVDQDDSICLPGYMTVRESMSFAAELSNSEAVPLQERERLIDSIMTTLGLSHIAGHRVGDARTRGISGGERRRLSLGVALVAQPKILICDESTSGLDAYSALRVMSALRTLASGAETGTTVIATLHQPSSEIFQMADRVILLDQGSTIFQGRPGEAIDFCQANGMPVPVGYNVADALLSYAFQQRGTFSPTPRITDKESLSTHGSDLQQHIKTRLPFHHGGDRPITTFLTQLHALLHRAWIMTRRDLSGPLTHVVGSIVISLLAGACFFHVSLDIGGFQNRVGSIFFIYIFILFTSLSALTGFAKERLLMMRERANGLYSPWSWVSSHLAYDLVLQRLIPSILIVCIIYWMVGLHPSAGLFFQFLLITVIFNWVVSIYEMLLAALFEEASTAILYGALFILFNLVFAGFILNLENMPKAVRWIRWLCPSKFALEAVATNELKGLQLIDNLDGVPISTPVSLFSGKLFGFQDDSYYRNLIILSCGYLLAFSVLLFMAVHWKMRERR
ncbi:hypothetical protein CBS101457_005594 [Exobasidium rhododendri]|nr:hypothetical protein CBS101457_005594 [Exobasidium rhododendri]